MHHLFTEPQTREPANRLLYSVATRLDKRGVMDFVICLTSSCPYHIFQLALGHATTDLTFGVPRIHQNIGAEPHESVIVFSGDPALRAESNLLSHVG